MRNQKGQVIVYIKKGISSQVVKCEDLEEGHKIYEEQQIEGGFDYLELALDEVVSPTEGKYRIIRRTYK